jgi:hypothetical protein
MNNNIETNYLNLIAISDVVFIYWIVNDVKTHLPLYKNDFLYWYANWFTMIRNDKTTLSAQISIPTASLKSFFSI